MNDASFHTRRNAPGKWASLALTVAVHLGLVAFLVFGVRWQSSPPGAMEVELVAPPAPRPAPVETPKPEQPKPEPPKPEPPKPEPPKPAPQPEPPKPEPPKPEPDIATKAPEVKKPPKPEPKPEPPKPEPPKPKPEPPKPEAKPRPEPPKPVQPPRDDYMDRLLAEESSRTEERAQIERMMRNEAAARTRAVGDAYENAIRTKVRGNLVRPPGLEGNPEAVFVVDQLPDGTVMNVRLTRSSGIPALDQAIERAIRRSSPLPLPGASELFQRTLELKFRPLED